ncbi:oligosaccharide flippase family protein [Rhodocaloribacter litoris]|uniref:lipopolysaccharide biosynthesis protein n=1 Tax=Rhodocaloribacter litoris TaxID=2558931 RepID=UPI00141E7BCE|nr:polysaccharide biosynthesis C-terminal domain-containing protein [Rhodocaloribacter litoris]QXD16624.1 oligosaccharide flippase family protein [Rhodocaloribacter litoris]GIV59378.1 MAG: polysaccharide biosynthesis protein [Rhodothermaceae bacterium]
MAAATGFFDRIKQLASETAVYGIASIVGRMIGYLLFPIYSHVFLPDQYGVISIVYTAFVFLNVVYQHGMESAYLKYAADSPDAAARHATFSTAVVSLLGTSVLLSVLMVGLRAPVGAVIGLEPSWHHLLYYAAAILLLDTLAVVPLAELRLQNRAGRFAAVRLVAALVNVGMNVVLLFVVKMGVEAVFLANVISSALALVLLLPTLAASFRPSFDGGLWRQMLHFALPFVPGGLGYAVTERINIFFLEGLSPERVLALYGRAMTPEVQAALAGASGSAYGDYVVGVFNGCLKLAVFMMLVTQMFRYAWQPFFLQHARDADARPLFARVFTLYTAAGLFVVLAVSFYAQELVALPLPGGRHLVSERYWMGLFIVPPALLGYLFQGWYYNFSAGAYIEKKTKYFVHCTLAGSALALVLNATLVPRYGMLAAAWATTLAYALMALLLYGLVRRFYPVPYAWRPVLGMGGLAAALFFLWDAVPALQQWWGEGLLLGAYLFGLLGLRIVSPAALKRVVSGFRAGA